MPPCDDRSYVVNFRAIQSLQWPASLVFPSIFDLEPSDRPELFGPLSPSRRRFVLIDEIVADLYGEKILNLLHRYGVVHNEPLCVPGGEASKSAATVDRIVAALEAWGVPRFHQPLLVWGGGVLHDVAGYAAAQYRRGVSYIMFATTLVCLIDAMFALKVAISQPYKNRLGAYHPPLAAYGDPGFLATLLPHQILDGAGEIFKVALALDGRVFDLLRLHGHRVLKEQFQGTDDATRNLLGLSLAAMAAELSHNPYEHNPARASYAGHDISAGMEPDVTHGVAVTLNLLWSTMLSWRRGHLRPGQRDRILAVAGSLGLPRWHPVLEQTDRLAAALADTARHRGERHLVPAPTDEPGTVVYLNEISGDELLRGLDDLRAFAR